MHLTNENNSSEARKGLTEKEIIEGCQRGDSVSQRALYERLAPKMLGVCHRYAKDMPTAEDMLHDGFITIYTRIGSFRGEGSFEGWCRRIFVNTALGHLRKKNPLTHSEDITEVRWLKDGEMSAVERMSTDELLGLIEDLPEGYRTVMNLYAIEGYSHREIGEMLEISENTSRSQYFRARERLMDEVNKLYEYER